MWWLCSGSLWLGWTTVLRIPFLACFWLRWAPEEILERFGCQREETAIVRLGVSGRFTLLAEAVARPAVVLGFPGFSVSGSDFLGQVCVFGSRRRVLGQVCVFGSGISGPGFCRMTSSPRPETARMDSGFSLFLWAWACSCSSPPDCPPRGLWAPASGTVSKAL